MFSLTTTDAGADLGRSFVRALTVAIFSGSLPAVFCVVAQLLLAASCDAGAHRHVCAVQIIVALLIAVAMLGATYKLCPSVISFIAKKLPGSSSDPSGGTSSEAETAPLMGDFDDTESMAM
eukprot:COSAG02_NODE_9855_length_2092_cov_1.536377_2_plen_121_part_00